MPRPHRLIHPLLVALAALIGAGAIASAPAFAAPALSASVVGEAPQGGGVFRFPQAVSVASGGNRIFVGDQYSSVVQAFDGHGNFLFNIGSRATRDEPGRFGVVGGVAVDKSGHLYVVDAENDRVETFDANDGHFISTFGDSSTYSLMGGSAADGGGITAGGIAVFQAGPGAVPIVYLADEGNDRIVKLVLNADTLLPTGPPLPSPASLGLDAPQGLAVDPTNTHLYIADDDHHRVVETTTDSMAFVAQTGSFGTGPGQLENPYDVAIDSSNPARIYVADNLNGRVQVFDATTLAFVATFGTMGYGPGVGNFEIVRALGALGDAPGTGIYVADTANNRIQEFDTSGNVIAAWGIAGRGPGYLTRPRGVTFSPDGGITATDTFDQRVAIFSPDGTYVDQRGSISPSVGYAVPGNAPGQFQQPVDAKYDAGGNLWISDSDNDRVMAESPNGAVITTSGAGELKSPRGLAAAPGGGMYVADQGDDAVSLVGTDGNVTVLKAGLANPVAVATDPTDPSGAAWAVDDHTVTNVSTGATIASPDAPKWDHPSGIAFDGAGDIYISEKRPGTPNGARIMRGVPAGSGTYTWDQIAGEGDGVGQVIEPGGLAVNAAGTTLLVADTGNDRVERFDAPGTTPPVMRNLTVGINDMTRGTVTSDVPGISCVTDCQQHYGGGRTVTLTAKAKTGFAFTGWTGDCAGAAASPVCSLPMTADHSTTATFGPAVANQAPTAPPAPALAITKLSISPNTVHPARAASKRRHITARKATHAHVNVTLNQAAAIRVTVLIGKPGRKQGSQCRVLTKKNKKAKPCTRWVSLAGHLSFPAAAARSIGFTTRWNRRQLAPGDYELSVTAVNAKGVRIAPTVRHFRVVR